MTVSHSWNRWAIHYRFFLAYLFAPLLVLKIHLLFSGLSWLLGIHHWLIPALSELRVLSGQKDWRFSLFLKTHPPALVLFFLPPHWQSWAAHLWISFSLVHIASVLKILSTASWEFPPFCVFTPYSWNMRIFFFFLDFLLFWWSSSSSNFLRDSMWKHCFSGLTCPKMSFSCPPTLLITWILYRKQFLFRILKSVF